MDDDLHRVVGRAMLDSAEGVFVLAAERAGTGGVRDLRYVAANAAAEDVVGVRPLVGRRLGELFPDLRETLVGVFGQLLDDGGSIEDEIQLRMPRTPHLDGHWIMMRASSHGDLVIVRYRDVTEQRELAEAIAASEQRFRSLVERAHDVIQVLDVDGVTQYASPALQRTLGYTPQQVLGRHFRDLVAAQHVAAAEAAFARCAAGSAAEVIDVDLRAITRDGRAVWVEGHMSNHLADPTVRGVVVNWRDVSERRRLQRDLEHQALHDVLTGLPNRRLFTDHLALALARARRSRHPLVVMFCDLDHFKQVNDHYGHAVGDELLKELGARLRAAFRAGDTVARFGGDEFVVLCEDITDGEAAALAVRAQRDASGPYRVSALAEVFVTVSIGVAVGGAESSPERLLSEADTALYEAKRRGRRRVQVFSDTLREVASRRVRTESALRQSRPGTSFELHYQPTIDLTTRRIVGAEALLRWRDPHGRLRTPGAFLDVAEDTGLITDIGAWVLRTACRQAAEWSSATAADLDVHINLSGRQLADAALLVGQLKEALGASGVDPARIELEVTETVLLTDLAAVRRALLRIKELGVSVALDDFGTGYSSLSWLQRFPVDTIKLDRSFISGLAHSGESVAIVRAVIQLAGALRLRTVGEGVERAEQLALLSELGCDTAQGFYIGRPVPAAELTRRLLDGEAAPRSVSS